MCSQKGVWTMCWTRLHSTELLMLWWLPTMRRQWSIPWRGKLSILVNLGVGNTVRTDSGVQPCICVNQVILSQPEWMNWVFCLQTTRFPSVSYWECVIRSASRWVSEPRPNTRTSCHSMARIDLFSLPLRWFDIWKLTLCIIHVFIYTVHLLVHTADVGCMTCTCQCSTYNVTCELKHLSIDKLP